MLDSLLTLHYAPGLPPKTTHWNRWTIRSSSLAWRLVCQERMRQTCGMHELFEGALLLHE